MPSSGKTLIFIGCVFIAIGLLLTFLPKSPYLGRLPGDIRIEKENFTFYFPLATCLLISAILSLILYLLNRR